MPYSIRKLPNQDLYRVYNTATKVVHSYATTLENAKKQVKLLHMVDAGVPLKKQGGSIQNPKLLELFKGTGSVGKQAKKMGFQVTSLDLDPIYTPDIETDILEWDYKKWATENNYTPDMIWSSPPCNTYSPMVYRLKERDVETAKPLSERAKIGTKILYKTLEIIEYFLKKNPKLLFIIENPRGMMRKDKEMKKLARETTLYCLYGDFKRKPTDFWNNFPQGLGIDQETKQCPNKVTPVQDLKTIDERYSMPSKLIKHFLEEFKDQYSKKGGSIETDRFKEEGIVSLPEFRSVNIDLPTYMYKRLPDIKGKPPPYRYKLVIPITSSRNLSSRKKETSLKITQKPVGEPVINIRNNEEKPTLEDFSPADKLKIQQYYSKVEENEKKNPDEVERDPYEIKQRGRPLPCSNAKPKAKPKERVVAAAAVVEDRPEPQSQPESSKFSLTDEELTELFLEDETAFALYNDDLEEFKKKYKKKYGKKYGFGLENNILSNNKKMANTWVQYVKDYAAKNGMSYRDALRDPNCKAGYKKGGVVKKGRGVVDEIGDQDLLAVAYNDSELGANAGRKFISL
jgi:hypothetical protein